MTSFKLFASLILTATAASTLTAETHCPENSAGVLLQIVNRHQMIVPVSINHTGPYNFLLDTGTQMTMVAPSLAESLHLSTSGTVEVASAGVKALASLSQLDLIEAGAKSAANAKVLVNDLTNLPATGLEIKGVLGEDFLEQFDMLIDNAHSELCLGEAGTMRPEMKGQHVALLEPGTKNAAPLAHSLIISAKLSDGMRPVRLKLDSGANVPFLYDPSLLDIPQGGKRPVPGSRFAALPAQTMKIGSVEVNHVSFITLAGVQKDKRTSDFDGLLTMGLFKRVFIDHADHFAVLEAW